MDWVRLFLAIMFLTFTIGWIGHQGNGPGYMPDNYFDYGP